MRRLLRQLKADEQGNASIYLLWFIFVAGIVLVLSVNVINAFGKQEQSSVSAEQASFAATDVVLQAVAEGVDQYDEWKKEEDSDAPSEEPQSEDDEQSVAEQIDKAKQQWLAKGKKGAEATIAAYDEVLKGEIASESRLREEINRAIRSREGEIKGEARRVISANGGLADKSEITLFQDDRVAVKAYTHYQARAYSRYIPGMEKDVEYTGYGPKLSFIQQLGYGTSIGSVDSPPMLP